MTTGLVVLAGSYAPARAPGIRAFGLDLDRLAFVEIGGWDGVVNPSFLAITGDARHLYAVSETGVTDDGHDGRIHCFDVVWAGGRPDLVPGTSLSTGGDHPCHLGLDPLGRWIAVANYGSGTVSLFGLDPSARLGETRSSVELSGRGPDPVRQSDPHPHSVTPTADGRHLVIDDLGADRVVVYAVDEATGALTHRCDGAVAPGAGPRHTVIHANGRLLVVANELASTVTTYVLDPRTGTLDRRDTASTLPPDAPPNLVADVRLAPDGVRLYASNRGHDSIATFDMSDDGTLARTSVHSCGGAWPRSFAVVPDGNHLVVANERSDELVLLPTTGDGVGMPVAAAAMPAPTCVLVVPVVDLGRRESDPPAAS